MAAVLTRRRRVCFAAAFLVLAGACGNPHGTGAAGVQGGASTTAAAPASGGGGPASGGGGSSATTSARHTSGGGGGVPTSIAGGHNDQSIADASDGPPGSFAGVLLAPSAAKSIVLDVLVQSGEAANASVLSTLRQILGSASGKQVTVRGPGALNASGNVHSADEIVKLADTQGMPQGTSVAVIHVLYLKGSFTDDSALGVTVRGDTTAIFPDQIAQASSIAVSEQHMEQAVDTHELGHMLGLVDLFLDDHRADPQHPGHSTNPHSVMYWAVESDLVSQVLSGPPPVDFDAADQADLQKIHSGAPPAVH